MVFIWAEKQRSVFYLSIGLLSLSLLTECEKIRLVGPSRCSGRVEVYHRDSWGTVCDDQWTVANADVVCRESNCGTVLEAKKGAFFGEGKDEIWLDDIVCTGQEQSILKCNHRPFGENNCGHAEDAGVVCSEYVRVVNGSNRCNGRIEVYHDGNWRRICDSDWGLEQAKVLCRETNCGIPATQTDVLSFGQAVGMVGVKATCLGNETSISQCKIQEFKENCDDATLVCTNSKPLRLMNGTRCSGRVEVFNDGQWGTVCDDRWGMQEATVTCREMNCGNAIAVKYKAFYGPGQDQVWLDDVECSGQEKFLAECPHRGFGQNDCDHNEDAGVICSETVRLFNGTDRCSGRLEVFHVDRWGKLCSNNWDNQEATLVCKELDCGAPKKNQEAFNFGETELTGFTSRCPSNAKSMSDCTLEENPGQCHSVSLSCSGNPPLRLVNSTNQCSGRVEVLHDGQWGTVCDDEWDIKDAQVVCRAMNCGTAQTAKAGAFFGQGSGDIWLDDVNCKGNESSLLHCAHSVLGSSNCGHGEDAGVVCSATIRLINGTDQCSGRVEFQHAAHWSPAYNINWGMNEATVVCREMNCGDPVTLSGPFGQGTDPRGYKVTCSGRESSITQCTLTEYHKTSQDVVEEAAVKCSGNIKIVGGPNRCDGRVEFYDQGQWGTVCGESWDMSDATVACAQLDCGRAHKKTTNADYGEGTGHTWLDQIECSGLESSVGECPRRPYIDKTCNTTSIAGVSCTGSLAVRLASGKDECSGRVEVRHGDDWHTVCDEDWTMTKANEVCQLLECGKAFQAPGSAHFGQGSGSVVGTIDSCFSNQTTLEQCSLHGFQRSLCGHERDASALCAAQVKLVSGLSQCSGRVEVHYKGQWGTVCDDEWQIANADVVCRQLGCGHAVSAPGSAHFGKGTGPIWLDNVECTGQESALTHCTHNGFGENNCGHGEDAGVICLGSLMKPEITLSPSPDVNWGDRVEITCAVKAEHLGGTFVLRKTQGSFQMEKYSDNDVVSFVFPAVDFAEKGSYFCEYQKKLPEQVIYFPQGNTADLSVTVKLDVPTISLTSPHAMVVFSPDKVSVNQGSSFSVTCSTHSKYPGGVFYLKKSNMSNTEAKAAFGHTIFYITTFEFPTIEYEDQGDYRCVYVVNISSLTFSSTPSKPLQVTVVAAASSVASGVVIGLVGFLVILAIGFLFWRRRGRAVGTLVQFSNRLGGAIKQDVDERSNGAFNGRSDRGGPASEPEYRRDAEVKKADVDPDNPVERDPEDLAGRVCYELEPLVLT